ncbi:DUF72 domain-containing protein [Rhodococcus sp. D2-41]|uniref:DUF72 domain-containing protein n=1 Tax=Speluncibacter jeojiensis TaxID=2710754 RepID=UPI00240FBE9D|nr:DUF72 domain-containing protein [Rhodococcus sp. D2-41]MDG3008862.1 DUF72 domain-containing protein [Rhodococcus sp. D2-41]
MAGPRNSRTGQVRVGISGWTYPGWRGDFYPPGLVHRRELAYAAERLTSIEVNGSFYALQRPASYLRWRDETPDDFVFAVKANRYITHMKRLVDAETAVANFLASGLLALGPKLGPILWQLPPTLAFDADRLEAFLGVLPATTVRAAALAARHDDTIGDDRAWTETDADRPLRHAVEVRHHGFAVPEAVEIFRRHAVAIVVADTAGRYPLIRERTADLAYLRLHGDKELYASGYTDAALDRWADLVTGWADDGQQVFAYFDNDVKGRAPFDALGLLERLARR